jgi:hypothetical protein
MKSKWKRQGMKTAEEDRGWELFLRALFWQGSVQAERRATGKNKKRV